MNSVSASKIRVNGMKRQSEINVPVFFFFENWVLRREEDVQPVCVEEILTLIFNP